MTMNGCVNKSACSRKSEPTTAVGSEGKVVAEFKGIVIEQTLEDVINSEKFDPSPIQAIQEKPDKTFKEHLKWLSVIKNGTLLSLFHSTESFDKTNCQISTQGIKTEQNFEVRIYTRRYWMLFLISILGTLNCIPWIQHSIVTNVSTCYYGVRNSDVNWTSLVYMVVYIPFMFPASWFLDRYGLRLTVLLGAFLNCSSALIQCASISPDGFPVVMASQTVVAIAHNFISPTPAKLAVVWFGPMEACRAIAVGVFGSQFGSALGFVMSPYFLPKNCSDMELVRQGKRNQTFVMTAWNLILFILLILTFEGEPPVPPSRAEAVKGQKTKYLTSVKFLMKNISFNLLLVSYGLNEGVFLALGTVLNAMLIPLYPDSQEVIGWIGATMLGAGFVGSITAGYILDWTHKYKETCLGIFVLSFTSICAFTGLMHIHGIWIQYTTLTFLGIFLTSYLSVGQEFAAEITYPEPEGTSVSLMWASAMGLGMIMTMTSSALMETYGTLYCNLFFCVSLFACIVVTAATKCEYRRMKENQGNQSNLASSKHLDKKDDVSSISKSCETVISTVTVVKNSG